MDEALKKSGDYPNIALTPGTHRHAATGEAVEIPASARIDGGTCKNVHKHRFYGFECSACRWEAYEPNDWGNDVRFDEFEFCPSCGRKVIEE